MKSIFLGTGSASGIPDPFCSCEYCIRIKKIGGKNIRKRSGHLLREDTLIEFSPDIRYQILENNIDFSKIKNILLTHTHNDHLDIQELIKIKHPVDVYVNQLSKEWLQNEMIRGTKPKHQANLAEKIGNINLIGMEYFKSFNLDNMEIIPLKARHTGLFKDEIGINFLITEGKCRRLHASDTGIYPEETFEYLSRFYLKQVIIECTFLDYENNNQDHLDYKKLKTFLNRLKAMKSIDDKTEIFLTHFGHDPKRTHEEIEEKVKELDFNIKVAYDNMEI